MTELTPQCETDDHAPAARSFDPVACDRAAAIFRALGDPNRLHILILLRQGPMCVTAIADELDDNLSAVSQRLKLLRSERIVVTRREGKHVFYALTDDCIVELIDHALAHGSESLTPKPPR
ncbi:MAG: ArsR family transcriptional regulator [Planctomycetota bacterium]|nr:MAG: ArsR family transcriptional regulator [Planctomycetota bacterium]REJ90185.1 MAG: ArsR family transcriptional regulator [Planctomycetota bacterium]REK42202.1 MAG: ArsR family transcriptional regulator [Planctomycetota bacterium]